MIQEYMHVLTFYKYQGRNLSTSLIMGHAGVTLEDLRGTSELEAKKEFKFRLKV